MKKTTIRVIPQTEEYGYDLQEIAINGEAALIEKFIAPSSTIFDVGSGEGVWDQELLRFEPKTNLYCFESEPLLCERLKEKLASHPQAQVHCKSLDGISSETLDEFCQTNGILGINLLRLHSKSLSVLDGATRLLSENRIVSLQFGTPQNSLATSSLLKPTMEKLSRQNYTLFRVFSHGLIHMSHWKDWLDSPKYCNYFAIQRSQISQCEPMIF